MEKKEAAPAGTRATSVSVENAARAQQPGMKNEPPK